MMEAARRLGGEEVTVYFSGNPVRPAVDWRIGAPANVKFTGFLPMHDYVDTIFSADIVVVLTTVDHCLLCGCYEAVAAEKPLITSDTAALRRHFFGAEFVHHDVGSLATGIRRVLANPEHFRAQSKVMRTELTVEWKRQFSELEAAIGDG
jgi:glycosyltransferase involved in cell wall biosynthesis